MAVSLRLKHGAHTFFLFVDPLSPFSKITDELLEILRERYPDGLSQSTRGGDITQVPAEGETAHVSYAVLRNTRDQLSGWKNLNIEGDETPASKSLKDNAVVAFAIHTGDIDEDEEPQFQVEFPELDDEEEMDDEQ